jgi:hypothetical protein
MIKTNIHPFPLLCAISWLKRNSSSPPSPSYHSLFLPTPLLFSRALSLLLFITYTHYFASPHTPPTSAIPTPISSLSLAFLRAPLYCFPPLRDLHPHLCPCLQKALCKSCNCYANPVVIYFWRLLTAYKILSSAWMFSVVASLLLLGVWRVKTVRAQVWADSGDFRLREFCVSVVILFYCSLETRVEESYWFHCRRNIAFCNHLLRWIYRLFREIIKHY